MMVIIMSYVLFKNIKEIESLMVEEQFDIDGRNRTNEIIFRTFAASLRKIEELIRYNRGLPFFDLNGNWAFIKTHRYEQALANLKQWLQMVDGRYDGENWNE